MIVMVLLVISLTNITSDKDSAIQFKTAEVQQGDLTNTVHNVPTKLDQEVAQLKLAAMDINIDTLTKKQQHYLTSWQEGTL